MPDRLFCSTRKTLMTTNTHPAGKYCTGQQTSMPLVLMDKLLQLLILSILLIQCDGVNVKITGLTYPNELKYNVENIGVWAMSCNTFNTEKAEKICNSYKECGFSKPLSTDTICHLKKEKNEVWSIICKDECKDKDCGWECTDKFTDVKHAKCSEIYQEKNSTDIDTWKDVTSAVLHLNGSRERLKLHLRLNTETGKNDSQNAQEFRQHETGKNDSQNESRQHDNTTNSTGWIICGVAAGVVVGFAVGCTACILRKTQWGRKWTAAGAPAEPDTGAEYHRTSTTDHLQMRPLT